MKFNASFTELLNNLFPAAFSIKYSKLFFGLKRKHNANSENTQNARDQYILKTSLMIHNMANSLKLRLEAYEKEGFEAIKQQQSKHNFPPPLNTLFTPCLSRPRRMIIKVTLFLISMIYKGYHERLTLTQALKNSIYIQSVTLLKHFILRLTINPRSVTLIH